MRVLAARAASTGMTLCGPSAGAAGTKDHTQRDGNHIHSVWRDPAGDFGRDFLARHYATSHH